MGNYDFSLDIEHENTMSVISSWIENESIVLEFGPANGRLTKYLNEKKKCKVTIVEIDENSGKEAAKYAETAYLGKERGDICNFYWLETMKKYDIIVFADVLEHLSNPELVLDKCRGVLNRNGKVLVSIPNIAHNSILIDLFNDKFQYDKVGLLDETHIHFFTYHTFLEMVERTGFTILKQRPIYSRVGCNEIDNHFSDVPFCVERELRMRRSGSVYQYVFCLEQYQSESKTPQFEDIPILNEEYYIEKEAICYLWKSKEYVDKFSTVSQLYLISKTQKLNFKINDCVEKLRIDIIKHRAIIRLDFIRFKLENGECVETKIVNHNADYNVGKIFAFFDKDAEIEVETNSMIEINSVEAVFQVLDADMNSNQCMIYKQIFENFCGRLSGDDKYSDTNEYMLQRKLYQCNEEKEQAINYTKHLERDIDILKSDILDLQKKSEEYQSHLEKDIKEQQEYIDHLEKDIKILKSVNR